MSSSMAFTKNTKDPFSTTVGHLIEIHTVARVKEEDWGQFMNICDKINSTGDGPRDAVKAFKKRIAKNYNQKEVHLSLSLLEMCMQNCNSNFQNQVLRKEFLEKVLVKHLNPKYKLPVLMQNRILRFIMTWATGSYPNVDQTEVKEVYLELIKKGIHFPSLEPTEDEIRQIKQQTNTSRVSDTPINKSCPINSPSSEESVQNLTPEQIGKLYSELDMVRMNMKVMSAILLENYPGSEVQEDMELLQELQKVCQEMQARIIKLLETVQNDDVIIELVQVNDDLNNLFLRYNRFSRTRSNQSKNDTTQEDTSMSNGSQPSAPSSELIELNHDPLPGVRHPPNGYPAPTATANVPVPAFAPPQVHGLDAGNGQHPLQPVQNTYIYPQRDLLELRAAVNTPFSFPPQSQLPQLPPRPLYDNFQHLRHPFPPAQNTTQFFPPHAPSAHFLSPPLLPTGPGQAPILPTHSPLFPAVPTLSPTVLPLRNETTNKTSLNPDDTNNNPPNYYELLEFDPLVDSNGTDAVYEEVDPTLWKPKVATDC